MSCRPVFVLPSLHSGTETGACVILEGRRACESKNKRETMISNINYSCVCCAHFPITTQKPSKNSRSNNIQSPRNGSGSSKLGF